MRLLSTSLLACLLASFGCGEDDEAQVCALYLNPSLFGSVVDVRGNRVPVQRATVQQGRGTAPRHRRLRVPLLGAGSGQGQARGACRIASMYATASLSWKPGEKGCHASGPAVVLTLEESCRIH